MEVRDEKVFEKLNDSILGNVSGGLEVKKPLNTVVLVDNLQDKNDEEKTDRNHVN